MLSFLVFLLHFSFSFCSFVLFHLEFMNFFLSCFLFSESLTSFSRVTCIKSAVGMTQGLVDPMPFSPSALIFSPISEAISTPGENVTCHVSRAASAYLFVAPWRPNRNRILSFRICRLLFPDRVGNRLAKKLDNFTWEGRRGQICFLTFGECASAVRCEVCFPPHLILVWC